MEKVYDKDGIKLFNSDCFDVMNKMVEYNKKVDIVLTSPPYNTTSRTGASDKYNGRYDIHLDNMTKEEYSKWTVDLFNKFNNILNTNGVIIYNMSYSSENTDGIWITIGDIIKNTNFTIADTIIWKKKQALPNNRSKNKLTRICEYIFIIVRKDEIKTFNANKKITSVIEKTGQANYENIYNFIEAKNNDGSNELNKATYSSELCEKLLNIYAQKDFTIYDSFMGTGTTAVACKNLNLNCIGSELSKAQCEFSIERLR